MGVTWYCDFGSRGAVGVTFFKKDYIEVGFQNGKRKEAITTSYGNDQTIN